MKKFEVKSLVVMLLALAMVLSLAACGKPDETTAPSDETDPVVTDPVETDPPETDPVEVDPPVVTDPAETDPPEDSDPEETDPKYDPIETDPPVTEPIETEPKETDAPETTEKPEETLSPSAGGDHEHVYRSQILLPPGCISEGEEAMVCSYCGDQKDNTPIEAIGHSYEYKEAVIISPTHHTAMVSICGNCGELHGIQRLLEKHTFTSEAVVKDYISDGRYTVFGGEELKCECGYRLYVASNASDGHCYEVEEGSGKLRCRCGQYYVPSDDVTLNNNPNAGPQVFAAN